MPIGIQTAGLLILSNVFMTFAWYAHLKDLKSSPLYIAVLVSWSIAFVEYIFHVHANRIGHGVLTLPQLKIMQEAINLIVFVPFALWYMREKITLDYLYAGLAIMVAVYFIFRGQVQV